MSTNCIVIYSKDVTFPCDAHTCDILQAARDVILNRSPEHTQVRQHTLRSTTSVYDLLTIVLARYGQFEMLSEVSDLCASINNNNINSNKLIMNVLCSR